ncbi:MAG: PQQ-dependent sugar dehydrogenase [Acidimicrobiales bacterium]
MRRLVSAVVTLALAAGLVVLADSPAMAAPPRVDVDVVVDGLSIPWDLGFTPDGVMVFTERSGRLGIRLPNGTTRTLEADLSDLLVAGESGLMGLVVDPRFAKNRRIYTCQAHTGPEVQVIAWRINPGYTRARRVIDPVVDDIPLVTGRHGGCRLRFFRGALMIATGDAAQGTNPQNLASLGGKVLRVHRHKGIGLPDNPFAGSANADTRRIYTYGHRNLQGLDVRPARGEVWTVEHGPNRDDEINRIRAGGNYGWDPVPGYNESVPMTDLGRYPNAVPAVWSSGAPTLATSGGVFVRGPEWGIWNGAFAVASLKNQSLRMFRLNRGGAVVSVDIALAGQYGRLRTPMMGPDGALYVTTANGVNDRILRLRPGGPPIGHVDRAVGRNGAITVAGWAIDPNTRGPINVHIYVDGELKKAVRADDPRGDVAAAHPGFGPRHGFQTQVRATPGSHQVCVHGINVGRGGNRLLGCRRT